MRIEFWRPAGENERFASHAFDGAIGKTVPWNFRETDDGPVVARLGEATVVAVEVAADGSGATFTVDVPGTPLPPAAAAGGMTFSVPPEEDLMAAWERERRLDIPGSA